MSGEKTVFKLIRYLKKYKKEVILGPLFKLVEAIFELITPLIMANIIDIGIKNNDTDYILRNGGLILLLGITGYLSTLVCQYMGSKASSSVGTELRKDIFLKFCSLSAKERNNISPARLNTIMTNDTKILEQAVAMLIRLVVRAPFLAIGAIIMAMFLDLQLSLVFLAVAPLVALAVFLIIKATVPIYKKINGKLDILSRLSKENLSGARVVRAFNEQENQKNKFANEADESAELSTRVAKISALLNPINYAVLNLAIIAILYFGGISVDVGRLTQGNIIAFVNYLSQILLALMVVANLVILFTKASAAAVRVNEILELENSMQEGEVSEIDTSSDEIIRFENVSFSYNDNGEYAVENLNFSVNKGETVGIIGGTGSGKSTVVRLIPRFFDAQQGNIYFYGKNVRDYKFSALREKIGFAFQKISLFTGSIRDNVAFGKKADDSDVIKALKIAQAYDFVTEKGGLDTPVLEGGKNLSGGQKQRLSIARAVCKAPNILIFDDSSSALDYATERRLREAVDSECNFDALFIISQRADGIKNADKIIVMDDGVAVGIGKHDELFENCDVYREICQSQMQNSGEGKK